MQEKNNLVFASGTECLGLQKQQKYLSLLQTHIRAQKNNNDRQTPKNIHVQATQF